MCKHKSCLFFLLHVNWYSLQSENSPHLPKCPQNFPAKNKFPIWHDFVKYPFFNIFSIMITFSQHNPGKHFFQTSSFEVFESCAMLLSRYNMQDSLHLCVFQLVKIGWNKLAQMSILLTLICGKKVWMGLRLIFIAPTTAVWAINGTAWRDNHSVSKTKCNFKMIRLFSFSISGPLCVVNKDDDSWWLRIMILKVNRTVQKGILIPPNFFRRERETPICKSI